jgi:hypothetical protein
MPELEAMPIGIILPPKGFVFCPHLPPIPQISKVTGAVNAIQPLPCLGEQCAIYAGCQGEESPKMARQRYINRLKQSVNLVEKLQSLPFVGPAMSNVVEWLKGRITHEEAKLVIVEKGTAVEGSA